MTAFATPPRISPEAPGSAETSAPTLVRDPAMLAVYELARKVARGRMPILVVGETGVGKEHVAELVHAASDRASGPFVKINCAAITESLFESELFGHERGSFTSAHQSKVGLFESAGHGTIFLDEIGELPLASQAKLLRAMEEGSVMRVGSLTPRPIRARFVAATNRDLQQAVAVGAFRRDLYYRIAGVRLNIPPLRVRLGEIVPLAEIFAAAVWREMGRLGKPAFTDEACVALSTHSWPGNVRELRNVIECAVHLAGPDGIDKGDLRLEVLPPPATVENDLAPAAEPSESSQLWQRTPSRERVTAMLVQCGGNQSAAAKRLGVSRRTLARWLIQMGLPRPRKLVSEEAEECCST